MTIAEAAEKLCVSIESIECLVKLHRLIVDNIDETLMISENDVNYFSNYLIVNGRLPGLPS